jgi:hypothetical protein
MSSPLQAPQSGLSATHSSCVSFPTLIFQGIPTGSIRTQKNVYSVFRSNPPAVGFAQLSTDSSGLQRFFSRSAIIYNRCFVIQVHHRQQLVPQQSRRVVALLVPLVGVLFSFSLKVTDDNDNSLLRYAFNCLAWNHWHRCYMGPLAADECIRAPCLSFSWNTSDELIMPYLLSHGCDCLLSCIFSPSIWFICIGALHTEF